LRYPPMPPKLPLGNGARAAVNQPNRQRLSTALILALLAPALGGCATGGGSEPAPGSSLPTAFQPQDIVGRWGIGVYLKDEDRARTELAAANQCNQPYVIALGPTGGVMMHLGAQDKPEELRVKGGPGGKTYIGPAGESSSWLDREVISYDGRTMLLRWADPKVRDTYGTTIYVRCPPEGAKPKATPKPKSKRKPKPAR
jgi:hypothetical protein